MKKLTINLILVLFASILLVACQKETSSVDLVEQQRLSVKDVFLKNYYQTSYTYGRSIDFEAEDRQMHLDEVFSSGKRAKGYLVTDKVSGELLYFVNYDTGTGELDIRDIITGDRQYFRWDTRSGSFDPVSQVMEVQHTAGRVKAVFWGWSCAGNVRYVSLDNCIDYCCYYVFYINTGCDPAKGVDCP